MYMVSLYRKFQAIVYFDLTWEEAITIGNAHNQKSITMRMVFQVSMYVNQNDLIINYGNMSSKRVIIISSNRII